MRYFLGVDVGNTKSHALVADETGCVLGFGTAGMGSWEGLGWDGAQAVLHDIVGQAFAQAGIGAADISGADFGYAGYDWPEDRAGHERIISSTSTSINMRPVSQAHMRWRTRCWPAKRVRSTAISISWAPGAPSIRWTH